jgi:hypothetical protein
MNSLLSGQRIWIDISPTKITATKQVTRRSAPLVSKEMWLKTTMICHLHSLGWWQCVEIGTLTCWTWGHKETQLLWKTVWQSFKRWNAVTICNCLPSQMPKRTDNMLSHEKPCALMFTEALVITFPKWEQSKCPWTNEWINKMWCTHTIEYYLAIESNKVLKHATVKT